MPHIRTRTLALLGAMGLAACSDTTAPTSARAPEDGAALSQSATIKADPLRPGERRLRNLARQVPGFAGFYFDESGDLVVQLKDTRQGNSARAAVAAFVRTVGVERGRGGRPAPQVRVAQAKYAFTELNAWREAVRNSLFELDGVVMLDLDERANRLVVGLSQEGARAEAEGRLKSLSVPADLVQLKVVGEAKPVSARESASAAMTTTTGCLQLEQTCRPMIGGFKTTYFRDGTEYRCTMGFAALVGGSPRVVNAAHCSEHEWSLDYTQYHQPEYNAYVGREVSDPRGWTCDFLGTWKCRYSDANLVEPSVPVEVGFIGRPTGLGSRTILVPTPRFVIASKRDAYVGERVHTVGILSGLHTGTVGATCVEYKGKVYDSWGFPTNGWHRVLCTDVADYNSVGGDSGGPVFLWDGSSSTVTLVGTNYARNETWDHAFFNPMSGIFEDLGSMEVRAPEHRGGSTPPPDDGGGGPGCSSCELMT